MQSFEEFIAQNPVSLSVFVVAALLSIQFEGFIGNDRYSRYARMISFCVSKGAPYVAIAAVFGFVFAGTLLGTIVGCTSLFAVVFFGNLVL